MKINKQEKETFIESLFEDTDGTLDTADSVSKIADEIVDSTACKNKNPPITRMYNIPLSIQLESNPTQVKKFLGKIIKIMLDINPIITLNVKVKVVLQIPSRQIKK